MRKMQDRPLAAHGLISYRYPSPFGSYIMIGASDDDDALVQAARSLSFTRDVPTLAKLEIWDGRKYSAVVKRRAPRARRKAR